MLRKSALVAFSIAISASVLFAAAGDGRWLNKVPGKDRARPNPLAANAGAIAGGEKLFHQNCASCHGSDASGRGKHPPLRTDRVRSATPGELYWLLTNGSLRNGMPSWSKLPEQQRWQLVSYLKTLQ
jgi:mono/diheme cytochrome c family protein